jgi:uncharacterized protein (DUF58 family)
MGIDTERSMTYQAFALAAGMIMLAALFTLRDFRPRLRVTRALPAYATAGVPVRYQLRIENTAMGAQTGLIVTDRLVDPRPSIERYLAAGVPPDARSFIERHSGYARWRWLARSNASQPADRKLATLAMGAVEEIQCEVIPRRRGRLAFDSITVACTDPLGVLKANRDYGEAQHLCVLPRRYRLPPVSLPGARRYQRGGVALAQSVGDSEEFVSLREYRPGDPLQRVHWRSFARFGEPIVKEFQDEFFERHCVVLDNAVGRQRSDAFEEAISIAASFLCAVDTQECLLDLMFVGTRPVVFTGGRGLLATERLLEVLAAAEHAGDDAFAALADAVLTRASELTGLVIVTPGWNDARERFCARLLSFGIHVMALAVVDVNDTAVSALSYLKRLRVSAIEQDLSKAFA